jgi:predicted nucleic-acid-binding Zn-ribbon protein
MQGQTCSKCSGEMDTGKISGEQSLMYISDCQIERFKIGTLVNQAKACLTCGYVELYLDAAVLRGKIKN